MNPTERVLAALRERQLEPKRSSTGWSCRCPSHEDRSPSLSIDTGENGEALLCCHAGCAFDDICAALGLQSKDLFAAKAKATPRRKGTRPRAARQPTIEKSVEKSTNGPKPTVYETAHLAVAALERTRGPRADLWYYHDEAGDPVGIILRWDRPADPADSKSKHKKTFLPVSKIAGGWAAVGMPAPRRLYALPELSVLAAGSRVFVAEGEKSADATRSLGLIATTSVHGCKSPEQSNWRVLSGLEVVILVDNDAPGEKYGASVMKLCFEAGAKSVRVVRLKDVWPQMPVGGDIVDLLAQRGGDKDAVRAEVESLADKAQPVMPDTHNGAGDGGDRGGGDDDDGDGDDREDEDKPSQADQIVRLAMEIFRLGQTPKGEPFAVRNAGPNVIGLLRGQGGWLRDILAREYWRRFERTMSGNAFTNALATLRGHALEIPPEDVHLRVGPHENGIVLDLGTTDGAAVIITAAGWQVVPRSPILFQRTALTGALPMPVRGGSLLDLRDLLNVSEDTWPILVGWMVSALIPDMPHAILMIGGGQGTGKTTAARFICGVFDASAAPTRSQPRDPEAWAIGAANSWSTVLDNVSNIPDWLSDALCKAVTGDGWMRRTLYTDGDVSVLSFRRVIVLTSIDAGSLRGDLGERVVLVDLESITPTNRRTERILNTRYKGLQAGILGALLDLLASVLANRDSVDVQNLPRMADFAVVLSAVDKVLGTNSLDLYADQAKRIAGEVIESDPVGQAILAFVFDRNYWSGSAGDLLTAIRPADAGREWPKHARGLASRMKRLAPTLEIEGVRITAPAKNDHTRTYVLQVIAQTARPPESPPSDSGTVPEIRAVEPSSTGDRPIDRPPDNPVQDQPLGDFGPSGGSGGSSQTFTDEGFDDWGTP